ncbi:MAG: metallophosphoesterase [Butyrivibrio sp.]|nr:metallophosphoesterase [Acetatifactor muris]MCM1557932.1 metallophosphoesterase [Butyrivibrio sp.]
MRMQAKEELLTTIQSIEARPEQRLLAVSDIHGHPDRLKRLLEQMHYGSDDILIIVGDLIEKGPKSLQVVQYVMDLCRQHPVYVSMGNVEQYRLQLLMNALAADCGEGSTDCRIKSKDSTDGMKSEDGTDGGRTEQNPHIMELLEFLRWAAGAWGSSLFQEMLAEMGVPVNELTDENVAEHMSRMREQFRKELDFLWSRPTILTAGDYLFVHGGVPTDDLSALAGSPAVPYLKNDNFRNQGYSFSRYTVVTGHWPTFLYRPEEENGSPLFDRERRILCIDGGCGLKYAGQLNGIMIPGCNAGIDEISWTFCDDFPVITALDAQSSEAASVHIQYFDNVVELLQEEGDMARVRQSSTGKEFEAPREFLNRWHQDDRLRCSDYCDARLEVTRGEKLSLILEAGGKYYVKNRMGKIGWYEGAV